MSINVRSGVTVRIVRKSVCRGVMRREVLDAVQKQVSVCVRKVGQQGGNPCLKSQNGHGKARHGGRHGVARAVH